MIAYFMVYLFALVINVTGRGFIWLYLRNIVNKITESSFLSSDVEPLIQWLSLARTPE